MFFLFKIYDSSYKYGSKRDSQIKCLMTSHNFLDVRYFFAYRRRSDFASIDLSGCFRRVHISIAIVGPHCTGALVCTVTYWWLTERR